MKHVVFYSGGIGSFCAAKRVADKFGSDDLILLFTDTKNPNDDHPHSGEDPDTYCFLSETARFIGGEFVHLSNGKNIWEIFEQERYMGNSRIDPCSKILKRLMAKKWVKENLDPGESVLYYGIGWDEIHRTDRIKKGNEPYRVEFPMIEKPYLTKRQMIESLPEWIKPPRLYALGFTHNNCGGFCVKGGLGQFKILYEKLPERYLYHEEKQEELFDKIGRKPFPKKMVNGKTGYLSLREYRKMIEEERVDQMDLFDIGGCGCFTDMEDEDEQHENFPV